MIQARSFRACVGLFRRATRPASWARCGLIVWTVWLLLLGGCGVSPQSEVWVIGLDGADWDILDPLIARGELPNLARLKDEGAWGGLRSEEPLLSPIIWTTIGTGQSPDRHGVTWFMSQAPDGAKIPIGSRDRRVRAVWDIASENGLEVGVIGWWATWPADPVRGWLVSDYAGWHSFGVTGQTIEVSGKVWPERLAATLAQVMQAPDGIPVASTTRFVHLPAAALAPGAPGPWRDKLAQLRQALATGEGYTELACRLLRTERPRLFAVYFEGTDAVQHLFHQYEAPQLPWVSEEDHLVGRAAVTAFWRRQDEWLGRLLALRRASTTIVIVSDHGFRTGGERLRETELRIETADHDHLPEGIVLVHGPDVQPGARLTGADIYDIAPTVLALLDLPAGRDMRGSVLEAAWRPARWEDGPPPRVATHEIGERPRAPIPAAPAAVGENMARMLRTLGYVANGDEAGGSSGRSAAEAVQSSDGAESLEQQVNLTVVLRKQGRLAEAENILRGLLQRHPGEAMALANLGRTLGEMGRLAEAEEIFRGLAADQPASLEHLADLAVAHAMQGEADQALAVYERGLGMDDGWALGHSGRAMALHKLGRQTAALAAVDRALGINPRLAEAHYHRGLILRESGRTAEAAQAVVRALELAPDHLPAVLTLAEWRVQAGDAPGAEALLRSARQQLGDEPALLSRLGVLALERGRPAEAIGLLDAAAEARPKDAEVLGNLGMAYAMGADLPRAAAIFERVVELDPLSAVARGQLGGLYAQLGRLTDAERHLSAAVGMEPRNPSLWMSLGQLHQMSRRLDDAERDFREAVRLAPKQARCHLALGLLLRDQGKGAAAREEIQKARQLEPGAVSAMERALGGPLP